MGVSEIYSSRPPTSHMELLLLPHLNCQYTSLHEVYKFHTLYVNHHQKMLLYFVAFGGVLLLLLSFRSIDKHLTYFQIFLLFIFGGRKINLFVGFASRIVFSIYVYKINCNLKNCLGMEMFRLFRLYSFVIYVCLSFGKKIDIDYIDNWEILIYGFNERFRKC